MTDNNEERPTDQEIRDKQDEELKAAAAEHQEKVGETPERGRYT